MIYEEYAGQAALDKHYASQAFGAMGKAMGEEGLLDVRALVATSSLSRADAWSPAVDFKYSTDD